HRYAVSSLMDTAYWFQNRLVQNQSALTSIKPPIKNDWDLLFQPMFDEYFKPPSVVSIKISVPTLPLPDTAGASSSTSNDQDAPSLGSNPSTNIQSTSTPSTHKNVHAEENNNDQAEEGEHLQDDEFTNPSYPEMYMFALTVSMAEPKNIKEAMADSAWIEAMQEELYQFDRLQEEVYVAQPEGFVNPDHPKKDSSFELTAFSDADHAGYCTAMSSAEAEYVVLFASCAQVMWMRTQLQDYGFNYNKIPLYCDSQSAIAISCNPVQHSRTKQIHTRYHFIKEQVENGIIELYFVLTEYQSSDMFTKALSEDRFKYLVRRIGMRCLAPADLEVLEKESA
nr:hypothetical protein [Tanacetum cinerariifolium]